MPRYKLGRCNLPEILDELGISNIEFAEKMGMSRQQAGDYINNKKKMGTALTFSVADTLGILDRSIYPLIEVPIKASTRRKQKSQNEE
ncbi:helix-turn-helix domain-containing protein [Paenibacillus sp. GCM10023248]|uniref:helix-turn-helix domain-containing protein n=1 Tax=unclassified Paenibacillus TaxID=185978 RepID=UPI00237910A5|nr:helix-turn-helix transcriptional regulator [Paenibacillus sp. MAHUQ-63]MDD9266013.1 helix-turn-helix transcriptional regulator [Paenibacillus sp. MAHUQ-63]